MPGLEQGGDHTPPREIYLKKEPLLIQTVDRVFNDVLFESMPQIIPLIRERIGMNTQGDVPGRENEDPEAKIDILSQNILLSSLDTAGVKYGIAFHVYSEHGEFFTGSRGPYFPVPMDPVDNTDELLKNLDDFYVAPWIVLAVYDLDNTPIGAISGNLRSEKTYKSVAGINYHHDSIARSSENDIPFRPLDPRMMVHTIKDKRAVLSAYLAKRKYKRMFEKHFTPLDEDRDPYSTLISTGGNFITTPIALGKVHVYIAPIEPFQELFAGKPFLDAANGEMRLVSPEGEHELLTKFNPDVINGRADLVLESTSAQLLDEITQYYVDSHRLIEAEQERQRKIDRFLAYTQRFSNAIARRKA